jgi:hypothetical protein
MSRNKLRIMMRLVTGHCHLRRHLLKLGLVDAFETASHVLCNCEELIILRFRHLGHYFLKPGDFVNNVLHFVECGGGEHLSRGLPKSSEMVELPALIRCAVL